MQANLFHSIFVLICRCFCRLTSNHCLPLAEALHLSLEQFTPTFQHVNQIFLSTCMFSSFYLMKAFLLSCPFSTDSCLSIIYLPKWCIFFLSIYFLFFLVNTLLTKQFPTHFSLHLLCLLDSLLCMIFFCITRSLCVGLSISFSSTISIFFLSTQIQGHISFSRSLTSTFWKWQMPTVLFYFQSIHFIDFEKQDSMTDVNKPWFQKEIVFILNYLEVLSSACNLLWKVKKYINLKLLMVLSSEF